MIGRLEPLFGPGLVIRYGEIVIWSGPEATGGLVKFLTESARRLAADPAGGRTLAERLENILLAGDPEPATSFVTAGPSQEGIETVVHGRARLWDGSCSVVADASPGWKRHTMGSPEVLVGGPAAAGSPVLPTDSPLNLVAGIVAGGGFALFVVPGWPGSAGSAREGGPVRARSSKPADRPRPGSGPAGPAGHFVAVDLRDVVLGGHRDPLPVVSPPAPVPPGLVLPDEEPATVLVSPGEAVSPRDEPVLGEPATVLVSPGDAVSPGDEPVLGEPATVLVSPGDALSPAVVVSPRDAPVLGEPAAVLVPHVVPPLEKSAEVVAPPAEAVTPMPTTEDPPAMVIGIFCSRGHFNHPDALYCARCGIATTHHSHVLERGPRPALGVLVVDDGSTFGLDSGYVLGTNPEVDPMVAAGRKRPMRLVDAENLIAPVHAEVILVDWDAQILDRGSLTGTFVLPPGSSQWLPVSPAVPHVLTPHTRVALGRRVLVFVSHLRN